MGEHVADGDVLLAGLRELRPVARHAIVVVEQAAVDHHVQQRRGHPFRRREARRHGVARPWRAGRVARAAPQIHDAFRRGDRRTPPPRPRSDRAAGEAPSLLGGSPGAATRPCARHSAPIGRSPSPGYHPQVACQTRAARSAANVARRPARVPIPATRAPRVFARVPLTNCPIWNGGGRPARGRAARPAGIRNTVRMGFRHPARRSRPPPQRQTSKCAKTAGLDFRPPRRYRAPARARSSGGLERLASNQ